MHCLRDPRACAAAWLAAVLIAIPGSSPQAATYFVDRASATCSNSGPGTEIRPYCSISAAVGARGGPGVTIVVAPGTYTEQVSITASGAPGSPLVLQAGRGVVLDGADDFSDPAQWAQRSGNVWLAAGVTWAPLQVFAEGARLTPSTAAPASLPSRSFTWVPGEGLYVNAGGGNPAGLEPRVGRRKYGFSLYARSWITIEGFTILHTEDRGINAGTACTNLTIARNTVRYANKPGIQVSGGSGMRIASNIVSDNNDHGISLTAGVTASVIEDNESFRNARPAERAANGIYLFGSPGDTLRGNRLHDNQDTGLHLQSGSNDCVAYLNRSWNNGDHGYDHLGASGTIHVCDLAYGNHKDGFSIEGASPGTEIHRSIAVNNGLTTNEFDLWVDLASTPGFVSNDNLFWNSTRQPPVKYDATLYGSVAKYSAASGQDTRSLQADPRFVNPAAGDFRLQPGSPAIGSPGARGPGWSATEAFGCSPADVAATLQPRLRKTPAPSGP
jgi:parallel beta-helix repeat protein